MNGYETKTSCIASETTVAKIDSRYLRDADDEMVVNYGGSDKDNSSNDLSGFSSRIASQLNIAENSTSISKLIYQCQACEGKFSSWKKFKHHMRNSHENLRIKHRKHYKFDKIKAAGVRSSSSSVLSAPENNVSTVDSRNSSDADEMSLIDIVRWFIIATSN